MIASPWIKLAMAVVVMAVYYSSVGARYDDPDVHQGSEKHLRRPRYMN